MISLFFCKFWPYDSSLWVLEGLVTKRSHHMYKCVMRARLHHCITSMQPWLAIVAANLSNSIISLKEKLFSCINKANILVIKEFGTPGWITKSEKTYSVKYSDERQDKTSMCVTHSTHCVTVLNGKVYYVILSKYWMVNSCNNCILCTINMLWKYLIKYNFEW